MLNLSRREIVKQISKQSGIKAKDVEIVYDTLEKIVIGYLKYAEENHEDTEIRIFNGLSVLGQFKEKETKMNHLTGNEQIVGDRLILGARLSRRFKEKINKKK